MFRISIFGFRIFTISLILIVVTSLAGCEAIQRKFTRKKKRAPLSPVFYQEGAAETRPHLELYIMHYTYWKSWHEELVARAGDNAKRDAMAVGEVLSHLSDMKRYLTEKRAEELQGYIDDTKRLTDRMEASSHSITQLGLIKTKLDNVRARIVRRFYYKKVRDDILPD